MSEARDMLDRMPLRYRAQIEQEVSLVWEMKRAAEESNAKLRAELKTWQEGCACTDKSKADVLALRARLADMETFILRNSDPYDMNETDTATFHEIGKRLVPQNY